MIYLFDTTLRDGSQGEDISFSVEDKLNISNVLDRILGLTFIEIQGGILLVPGSGFGIPSYFRLSYAVDKNMAKRSLVAFEKLFNYYKKNK